jgi:hypothetical protein
MRGAKLNWRKAGSGYLPPLPNAGSEFASVTTKLLDLHYSNLRIAERWDWARYQRLCSVLRLTEYELASLVLMPHEWVPKMKERNVIPCMYHGGGRAVGLVLTMLEARVLKKVVADVIEEPMPNLNSVMRQGEGA